MSEGLCEVQEYIYIYLSLKVTKEMKTIILRRDKVFNVCHGNASMGHQSQPVNIVPCTIMVLLRWSTTY